MTAYSFKKYFAEPIISGRKRQTIRAPRKARKGSVDPLDEFARMIQGHVQPGGALQLYTGMRTRHCRKIGDAKCTLVVPIVISFKPARVKIYGEPLIKTIADLNEFSRSDGFKDWLDMVAFWEKENGAPVEWSGVLIRWDNFLPGAKLERLSD